MPCTESDISASTILLCVSHFFPFIYDSEPMSRARTAVAGLLSIQVRLQSISSAPMALLPAAAPVSTVFGDFPALSNDESKHWSKALAKILRHGQGQTAIPPNQLPVATLVQDMHASSRYGGVTAAKLYVAAHQNRRFQCGEIVDPVTNSRERYIKAVRQ